MRITLLYSRKPERLARLGIICNVLVVCSLGWCTVDVNPVDAAETKTPVVSFTAVSQKGAAQPIVVQWDAATEIGFDWEVIRKLNTDDRRPDNVMRVSVEYLVEGIRRMTGRTPAVVSSNDLSRGIVLTTLAGAPPELQRDPAVVRALRNTGEDLYNNAEAFYIRSEKNRVLVIANRWDGLSAGIVELLDTVGYEILGMGANWIHTPNYRNRPLVFAVERAGRPSYYIRRLGGGSYNGTTYGITLADPADEHIIPSLMRLRTGFRVWGSSMPPFIGHALDSYHGALAARLKETGTHEGFLTRKTILGLNAGRPAATADNKQFLWINTDATGTPAAGKAYLSNGTVWVLQKRATYATSLDLSVKLAREVVLDAMKRAATAWFAAHLDEIFVFGTEPEDGSYATLQRDLKHPNWYPDYLRAEGVKFRRPYALHGFSGLDQPRELWDPKAASDHVFGFNNWLLREYDKWIDRLPFDQRVTATGQDKKARVRTSSYSYNFHDVPPNFNLDPRIRVMVAGYPKHRGTGKWIQLKSYADIAAAFHKLLPREPSGEYRIASLADFGDRSTKGIAGKWSASPAALVADFSETFKAGTKALTMETDFNYGKYGLGYYLMSKLLWNARLTVDELDAIRDRWLQRAYGSGWTGMKSYYDSLLPENYPCNTPGVWGRAIRLLDEAAQQVDGRKEPDVQRRFDDLKQFWNFYYLLNTGQAEPTNAAFREFMWKCQTSYITSTDMVIDRFPNANRSPIVAAGSFAKGPAHYTHQETNEWWAKVMKHWPATTVDLFSESRLADGTAGHAVDLNDLVSLQAFAKTTTGAVSMIDRRPVVFYTSASRPGATLGFHIFWPFRANNRLYRQRMVTYELDRWHTRQRTWVPVIDRSAARILSQPVTLSDNPVWQSADVSLPAPSIGVYRFRIAAAGSDARLAGVTYDVAAGKYMGTTPLTFATAKTACYDYFGKYWFYIPSGTKTLGFEMADTHAKILRLHTGGPSKAMKQSRQISLSEPGTKRIPLRPGEDGNLASFERSPSAPSAAAFHVPYLYSVPMLWSRSPSELMLPRAVARADGLNVVETQQPNSNKP